MSSAHPAPMRRSSDLTHDRLPSPKPTTQDLSNPTVTLILTPTTLHHFMPLLLQIPSVPWVVVEARMSACGCFSQPLTSPEFSCYQASRLCLGVASREEHSEPGRPELSEKEPW